MFIAAGNFESGPGGWRPLNYPAGVDMSVVDDAASAKQGSHFLRVATGTPQGSIAHDVRIPAYVYAVGAVVNNQVPVSLALAARSLQFSVWLKAAPGHGPIAGVVAIWDLDANVSESTAFDVGEVWTQFSAGIDRASASVRVEIYLNTVNRYLYIDAARLV